jgi:uncharacterized protein
VAHFVYKLVPPRPTFAMDMSETEAQLMGQHAAYWRDQMDQGHVIVFGPVMDPAGVWGLGVLDTADEDEARTLVLADPIIEADVCTFELHPMDAVLRPPA